MGISLFPAPRALGALLSVVAGSALLASFVPTGASAFEMQASPGLGVTPTAPLAPKQPRAPLTVARAAAVRAPQAALVQTGTTLLGDGFSESATPPGAWNVTSGVCLTAGTSSTPATSIAACGSAAPVDPIGEGALELTLPTTSQVGMMLNPVQIATANGLQVTFTDYSFGGSTPGADGTVLFLTDASKPIPTAPGQIGGSLGYANANGLPGLANGYLGLALDEYGNYSNPTEGRTGGPGAIPETIAIRGAATVSYPYLGGATVNGKAASLPFSIDQPAATTRPINAPTVRLTLTPAGLLSVAIDHHDGNGFVAYYSQTVVGVAGQPAVPANVYVGIVSSTGGSFERHQIGGFAVTSLTPTMRFTPTSIANLTAWLDASSGSGLTLGSGGSVSSWNDKSGNGNTLLSIAGLPAPVYTSAGIDGFGSVAFSSGQGLIATNSGFSSGLFNESTTFLVTNQVAGASALLMFSGPPTLGNPHWSFQTTIGSGAEFDFNDNNADGKLAPAGMTAGPAMWSAAGSVSSKTLYLRKNGNVIATGTGPIAVSGAYQLGLAGMPLSGGTGQLDGQLGEMIVYNRFLSATESQQVEGYLGCKWGLQNRLPANHPYHTVCPQGGSPTPLPTATPSATAMQNPPELRSVNGSLVFNVTAQQNASGNPQFVYQGSTVMPTLRLLPGDTLIVNLVNALPAPPAGAAYFNDASLHYHGMHVSPNAPGDDSIDLVAAPGQSLHYQIAIPANHPTGLYWYHSHAHGETDRQNSAGMSGALIVDGIAAYAPQVANIPERVLVVRDGPLPGQALPNGVRATADAMRYSMSHGMVMGPGAAGRMHMSEARGSTTASTRNPYVLVDPKYRTFVRPLAVSTHCTTNEAPVKALTLNGQAAGTPSIGIRPGEQQFWRLVNAGSDTYLDVQVDNTQMQILALDGVPIGNGVNVPQTMTVSHFVVPPSSRIEFIVTGPPSGTTAFLRTNCFDAGSAGNAMPAATLATIDPTTSLSDLARTRTPQRIGTRTVQPRNARFITAQPVARTQSFFYSDQNTINGVAYDPSAPPMFYAQSGTVEEWTVINNSSQVHTFHIHQLHFVLEAINGIAQSQEFLLDNVNVPAANANGPGSVKILVDFTDPIDIGTFLLHCHILSHEDGGMMAAIRVGTAPPMTVSNGNVSFASSTAPPQTVTLSGGKAPFSVTGCSGVANASVSGSSVTISPVAAGGCVLTVSDSSGLTATVSVLVAAAAPAMTLAPTSVSFTTPTSPPQAVTISGGTPGYTAVGCSGVASGAISGATLTVTPRAVGSCSMTVTDSAANSQTLAVSVNAVVTGSAQDNLTFHQNAARQGWYQAETALTTTNVATTSFGMITTLSAPAGMPAFGKVYAQPLYVTNETVADGSQHNLVLIATSTDQLYAFDDVTRAVVWHRDFTNAAAGIRQQLSTDTACNDVNPNVGIVGTPVVDRSLDRMYVAVPTYESGVFHLRLHVVSLKSGLEATNSSGGTVNPVEISGSATLTTGGVATTSPEWNFARAALLEANGNVYVGLGSHCDFQTGSTHGWLLAYNATTLAPAGNAVNFTDTSDGSFLYLGAIWGSGFGPAADAQGNIYVTTGNGSYNGTSNFAMSAIQIPGNLDTTKASAFTPFGVFKDSAADDDFGSGGIVLLPDQAGSVPHIAIAGGKCGSGATPDSQGRVGTTGCQKYLLNRDKLGGRQSGDAGALWHADTAGGMWGGPAYFVDSTGVQHIVYGLNTYNLNLSPISLTVQSTGAVSGGCLECRDAGAQPVVSSNGTTTGTAIVWALQTPSNSGGTIRLFAFDALKLSHILFSGSAGTWTLGSGASYIGGALVSPLVANGKVYVPSDGVVTVFGLH